MSSNPNPGSTSEDNASRVLDSLILDFLERRQLGKAAAAYREEAGLQHPDPGIQALDYCFLSQWFTEFWTNWYLKHSASYQSAMAQQQQSLSGAVMGNEQSRPGTPFAPLYQQGASSTTSQFTNVPNSQGPSGHMTTRSSGSLVSPGGYAGLQPAGSLQTTHSEPADLLAMSQRLLANSSAAGALGLSGAGVSTGFQASPVPPLASPFQQQGSLSGGATNQLALLSMNGAQQHAHVLQQGPVTSTHSAPAGPPPVRRNLSGHFAPHTGLQEQLSADASKPGLRGHHSASYATGHHGGLPAGRTFTAFTPSPEFTPFTALMDSPRAPPKSHSFGGLHSAPSAPPAPSLGPLTPPSRKRKVQLQTEPTPPLALLHASAAGSLYAQGGEQMGSQRVSSEHSSEQTVCSPHFMLNLDMDFLPPLSDPGDKPHHAHSMPAALRTQDQDMTGLEGLLPLLDDDADLQLHENPHEASLTAFL